MVQWITKERTFLCTRNLVTFNIYDRAVSTFVSRLSCSGLKSWEADDLFWLIFFVVLHIADVTMETMAYGVLLSKKHVNALLA
jgi:hypothetical protein